MSEVALESVTAPIPEPKPIVPGTEITTPKDKPTEEPKKDLQSQRFAALAKKEGALVRERAAIKMERDKIAQVQAETSKLVEAQKLALTNPLKALELLGITYKQLTEVVLNDNQPTPELREKTLEERLRADFDKKLQEREEKELELRKKNQTENTERVVREFKDQTTNFLKTNKDKYPLINHPKNDLQYTVDTISALIEQNFHKTAEKDENGTITKPGVLMAVSDAAKMFEDHLAELADEFHKAKQPKSDGADPKTDTRQDKVDEPRTISNSMSSGLATNLPAKTEADRIKRALAALG